MGTFLVFVGVVGLWLDEPAMTIVATQAACVACCGLTTLVAEWLKYRRATQAARWSDNPLA
jgi:hypothetical protein